MWTHSGRHDAQVNASDFDYDLPLELIAQVPIEPRDSCRLLVLNRADSTLSHRRFSDLPDLVRADDLLVFNDTRVFPARLQGRKPTGGQVETLLIQQKGGTDWTTLVHPGLRTGQIVEFSPELVAEVIAINEEGERTLRFSRGGADLARLINLLGHLPTPPYIKAPLERSDDYQTIYAHEPGSIAAPTAGLHFTEPLLRALVARGVELAYLTLHVGIGTFRPVKVEDLAQHRMHAESYHVTDAVARQINRARDQGRRIVAVGTTAVRTLESIADENGHVSASNGEATLFIVPGYRFRCVDALITNFHVPRSTLLMLVSALAGRERILAAYEEAKARGYRFFSFGDAMLIV